MKLLILNIFLLAALPLQASEVVILSEKLLKDQIEKAPPSVEQIEASFLQARADLASNRDRYSYRLEAEGRRSHSKESPLNQFVPVTKRATYYSFGITKPTAYGMEFGAATFGDKSSNNFFADGTTVGVSLSMTMDLYKDFLGRNSKADLKKNSLSVERAKLEKEVSLKSFESNVRKIYWSLVANSESIKVTTKLLNLSKRQLQDALERQKSSVADAGEVARYRAQLSGRSSSLLSLRYQRAEIIRSLKELLPDLADKKIELAPYDVPKTITRVLICSESIASKEKAPLEFTPYDDIVKIIDQEEVLENKVAKSYDSADLRLTSQFNTTGKDFGFGDSYDEFTSDGKPSVSLGLKLTIPLGSKKKDTEEIRKKIIQKRAKAARHDRLAKVEAFHTQTSDAIKLLNQVVYNQKISSKYLAASAKETQKKYSQARATVQDLVIEQDSLLQSDLDVIQTNLAVINTLLDYFSVFTKTPCDLNRI